MEVHTIGQEYFNLILNAQKFDINGNIHQKSPIPIIGLTGTPNKTDDFKKNILYKTLPIVYEYYNSAKDGLINKTNYWVYEYKLNNDFKILTGTKDKKWLVGEKKQYEYLTEQYEKAKYLMFLQGSSNYFQESLDWMKSKTSSKEQKEAGIKFFYAIKNRKEFLWTLESSKQIALYLKQIILSKKENKVLMFSELTSQAEQLSKYCIHSKTGKTSKETQNINEVLLNEFNNGKLRELASVRSLQLGLNLIGANWSIIESYSGSDTNQKQNVGRNGRLNVLDSANVVIIKPLGCQSIEWFNNAFEDILKDNHTIITSINQLIV